MKRGKWDNCNSIINKYILKKLKKELNKVKKKKKKEISSGENSAPKHDTDYAIREQPDIIMKTKPMNPI